MRKCKAFEKNKSCSKKAASFKCINPIQMEFVDIRNNSTNSKTRDVHGNASGLMVAFQGHRQGNN